MSRTNHSVRTRERLTAILVLVVIPLTLLAGVQLLSARRWYFIALLIVAWLLLPHFFFFERRRPQAREIVLLAVLTALAVISRAVFFLVPNFKPVLALLVIYGAALGGRTGFLLGALTALVSNFLFGQGPWTLWQMFAWGMIGYTAGILVRHFPALARRWPLAIFGFFAALCIHGGITNPAGVLLSACRAIWFWPAPPFFLSSCSPPPCSPNWHECGGNTPFYRNERTAETCSASGAQPLPTAVANNIPSYIRYIYVRFSLKDFLNNPPLFLRISPL